MSISTNTRERWNPALPHSNYTRIGVSTLPAVTGKCAMCSKTRVRFLHALVHPEVDRVINVGCCCAMALTGDSIGPKADEIRLRGVERRRAKWLDRWRWLDSCFRDDPSDAYPTRALLRTQGWCLTLHKFTVDYELPTEHTPEDVTRPWIIRIGRRIDGRFRYYECDETFETWQEAAWRALDLAFAHPDQLEVGEPLTAYLDPALGYEEAAKDYWHAYWVGKVRLPADTDLTGYPRERWLRGYEHGKAKRDEEMALRQASLSADSFLESWGVRDSWERSRPEPSPHSSGNTRRASKRRAART